MASTSQPRILTFFADGTIAKGKSVKIGSDNKHVAVASAASDKQIGIAQNDALVGEYVEVAINGGGAKALAGGSISAGDMLTSDADGKLVATSTNAQRHVAVAMEDAVANDIFASEVQVGII